MSGDAAIVTNLSLYKSLAYDPVKDLAPISQVAFTTNILAVSNDVPAKTVQELVALARAQPGKLTVAHGGLGFSQHLAGEVFKFMAGLRIEAVPFRGGPAVMPELMAGRVTMCFCNISTVLPLAREGKMRRSPLPRASAHSSRPTCRRWPNPASRTSTSTLFGLLAPAGTPAAIIDKLHRETARTLALPETRETFNKLGMETIGNSPAEFAAVDPIRDSPAQEGDQVGRDHDAVACSVSAARVDLPVAPPRFPVSPR